MKKLTAMLLCILLLAGCAQSYDGPTETVRVLTAVETIQNGETRRTDYAYDLYGNCTESRYSVDGKLSVVVEWTYDEAGNQLTETRTDHGGLFPQKLSRMETTYDNQGRVLTVVVQDSGGREQERTDYTYDGSTVTKTISPGGLSTVSEYDENGLLLRTYRADSGAENIFTYDENGNETACHRYTNGTLESWSEWTYDENGCLLSYTDYSADGAITDRYTCTYDDEGTVTQTVSDGTRRVERYDAEGNLLRAERYDAAGNLTMTQEHIYEDIQAAIREETP